MNPKIILFDSIVSLASSLAVEFQQAVNQAANSNPNINIALSGGATPKLLFQTLTQSPFQQNVKWSHVQLFWADERCVPPNHPESNFWMTKKNLLDHIIMPPRNIHRIFGEANPLHEVRRYVEEIENIVPKDTKGFPKFDWIFLGMGTDGHTASIFPGSNVIKENNKICVIATHPETGQKRITLTLPVINHAKRISFLVTGHNKALMAAKILSGIGEAKNLPAAMVQPSDGMLEWFLDQEAGRLIEKCTDKAIKKISV